MYGIWIFMEVEIIPSPVHPLNTPPETMPGGWEHREVKQLWEITNSKAKSLGLNIGWFFWQQSTIFTSRIFPDFAIEFGNFGKIATFDEIGQWSGKSCARIVLVVLVLVLVVAVAVAVAVVVVVVVVRSAMFKSPVGWWLVQGLYSILTNILRITVFQWEISRILKWRYVSTICLAIFSGDIPWNLGLNNRPYINRYLQFRFLEFPLIITIHLGIPFGWFLGIPITGGSNGCNFLAGLFGILSLETF